jgi:crotonobetainyl-CoA:carnitine CoA-transferase CaiB-like acyl-CoA transferase
MNIAALPPPLTGIVVLDLGQIFAGSYCGFLLAMAGATVIKIEPPRGDVLRTRIAFRGIGGALPFAMLNANKKGMTLDLKRPEGKELLFRLVKASDVLLENFAPGALARLGVTWEALHEANPRLVYAALSGYGTEGPYKDYPAMDLTIQAMAGIMSVTGFADGPPVKAGPAVCDFNGGVHLYAAIVTALVQRERLGVGQRVEVALQDATYPSLASSLALHATGGKTQRTGNQHAGLSQSPYNVYRAKDGYIAILCISEQHWQSLTRVMERPDLATDERFSTMKARVKNMALVDEEIAAWLVNLEKDAAFELLIGNSVPSAPVRGVDEVMQDRQMHETGMLEWFDHPEYGRMVLPRSPLRFTGSERVTREPSPGLGEHNRDVLRDLLAMEGEEIERLVDAGVVS